MRMADRHLISECLDGDSSAFGVLVDRYRESIYALAYSKLHNFHDAEDVTQEAFMKAYQNLRTLRVWDDFHAWLYAIANSLCKMWLRSESSRPDREFIEDHARSFNKSLGKPERDNMIDQLYEALESLPDTYQQVLTLHYLGGMDATEIAEFLGVSPTSIWQRLSRARLLLRKEMLDMMSETFEQNRLRAGFTFRIVEMIKNIRINPVPPKTLPWGISIATGIIIAILGIGTNTSIINNESYISGSSTGESSVLNVGEFPVDMVKVSDIPVMSNQQSAGNGLGSTVPSLQNALFMAPQAGDTWTKRADMTTERYSLGVSTVNGKIYAVGGAINWGNTVYKILEEYDPETDTWRKRSDMPTARHYLASTALNGKLYAIGGVGALSKVEEYDTIKDNWISKSDMMTPRLALAACEANGRIYSIGGTPDWVSFVSTVEEYDPKADKWIKKANMPTMRGGLAACTVNGKIYAIGGSDEMKDGVFSANALSTVEEYNPKTDTWTRKADMPTARSGLCAVAVNGKIYVMGGSRQLNGQLNIISTLEEYDPYTDKWTKKADMPGVRNVFGADSVNGKIYAIGGFDGGTWLSRVEEYDTGFTGESINPEGKLPTTWGEVRTVINR